MLVLSRKVGESIVIGDGITIKVLGIHGGRVALGATAPDDVAINRAEVLERKKQEGPPLVRFRSRNGADTGARFRDAG